MGCLRKKMRPLPFDVGVPVSCSPGARGSEEVAAVSFAPPGKRGGSATGKDPKKEASVHSLQFYPFLALSTTARYR
jgi:hypothetical protein